MAAALGSRDTRPRRGRRQLSGSEIARARGDGLELRGLVKRFGDVLAVDQLDLEVEQGQFLTLLGPSGCGKTTVLRLVAGFETPDGGSIRFGGRDVERLSPQKRGFGMVFQSYALFPHLDVFENVAFGLKARGDTDRLRERVDEALGRVNLTGYADRAVQALSGGQQQRVALARALAIEPPLLLLDEPLSNLDAALRERTRTEIRSLVKSLGLTAVFVTHDQEEAFALSDRIAVLREGRLQQAGTPRELYDAPANPWVAAFVGRANRFVEAGEVLLIRPEDLEIGDGGRWEGTLRDCRFAGASTVYRVDVDPEIGGLAREGGSDGETIPAGVASGTVEIQGVHGLCEPGDRVRFGPRPNASLHRFDHDGTP